MNWLALFLALIVGALIFFLIPFIFPIVMFIFMMSIVGFSIFILYKVFVDILERPK